MRHHQGRELVVVAKDADSFWAAGGTIELGRRDGVIFVDNGNHSQLEQSGKRGADSDRKSTRLNSSHRCISYAVFCLKKKKKKPNKTDTEKTKQQRQREGQDQQRR